MLPIYFLLSALLLSTVGGDAKCLGSIGKCSEMKSKFPLSSNEQSIMTDNLTSSFTKASSSSTQSSSSSSSFGAGSVTSKSSYSKQGSNYSSDGQSPVTTSSFEKHSYSSMDKESSGERVPSEDKQPVLKTPISLGLNNGLVGLSSQSSSSSNLSSVSSSNKAFSSEILSKISGQNLFQTEPSIAVIDTSTPSFTQSEISKPSEIFSTSGKTSSSSFAQSSSSQSSSASSSSSDPQVISSNSYFSKQGSNYFSDGESPVTTSSFEENSYISSDKQSSGEGTASNDNQPVLKSPISLGLNNSLVSLSNSQNSSSKNLSSVSSSNKAFSSETSSKISDQNLLQTEPSIVIDTSTPSYTQSETSKPSEMFSNSGKTSSSSFEQSSSSQSSSASSSSSDPQIISSNSYFSKEGSDYFSDVQPPVTPSSFEKNSYISIDKESSSQEGVPSKDTQLVLTTPISLGPTSGLVSLSGSQSGSSKSRPIVTSNSKISSSEILSEINEQDLIPPEKVLTSTETKASTPIKLSLPNNLTSSSSFKSMSNSQSSSSSSISASGSIVSDSSFSKQGSTYSSDGQTPVFSSSFEENSQDSSDKGVSCKDSQPKIKKTTFLLPISDLISSSSSQSSLEKSQASVSSSNKVSSATTSGIYISAAKSTNIGSFEPSGLSSSIDLTGSSSSKQFSNSRSSSSSSSSFDPGSISSKSSFSNHGSSFFSDGKSPVASFSFEEKSNSSSD